MKITTLLCGTLAVASASSYQLMDTRSVSVAFVLSTLSGHAEALPFISLFTRANGTHCAQNGTNEHQKSHNGTHHHNGTSAALLNGTNFAAPGSHNHTHHHNDTNAASDGTVAVHNGTHHSHNGTHTNGTLLEERDASNYTIQAGDTMFSIAQALGISLSALEAANSDVDPDTLQLGQVLLLPGASGTGTVSSNGTTNGTLSAVFREMVRRAESIKLWPW